VELASWNCELYDLVIDLLQYETAWIRVRCCLTPRPVRETEKHYQSPKPHAILKIRD
jgi:hypothetical protein